MKPRLIGALIIIAVATIVLPLLFQNPVKYPDIPDFTIPPEPAMPELEKRDEKKYAALKQRVNELSASRSNSDLALDEAIVEIDDNEANDDKAQTFKLDKQGLPMAWSVQLGTFKDYQNAVTLQEKLRDAGFNVYTKRINSSDGGLIQVLVGPIVSRTKVDKLKIELGTKHKLDGVVIRYMR